MSTSTEILTAPHSIVIDDIMRDWDDQDVSESQLASKLLFQENEHKMR